MMKNRDSHNEEQWHKLSPTKRALLERRLRGEGKREDSLYLIPKRTEQSPAPLSFAQQRLWFLDQLEPHNPAYAVPIAFRLKGRLNVRALEESLNEIVRRHEVLRTTFSTVDGKPVQVIAATLSLHVSVVDVREFPEAARETEASKVITEEVQRPFDLSLGPLLRVHLLRLDEEVHILLIIMHHIVSDEWSMEIFYRELSTLYEAFSTGKPSSLPELPIQYADFAVWQREWLQGENLDAQLRYWREQLAGAPPSLELPMDHPRPSMQRYCGARQSLVLPRSVTQSLKMLCRQEENTLFMTLLSAFKTLLFRYTGQEDISVGTPITNRNRTEMEGLIGFFINTLVLHTDLSGNPTFRELMRRIREVCLRAYAHQDVPFEKLVEELQPERNLNSSPLFQVMFVFQDATALIPELSGLSVSLMQVDSGTSKFDLTLFMREDEGGLRTTMEYNTDLFDVATIRRMLGHLGVLVEGIVSDPDRRLRELPLLTKDERHQVLVEWNATQAEYPRDVCVHRLFEAQVERTPDTVAVVYKDQQLTYRELNTRANQLAHHLRERGIGPEVFVGICVERSLEMVVGLLGILKAGGTYVPLDPAYPRERLVFMLEDAEVSVLLTQERLVEYLPEKGRRVICLDTGWEIIAQESDESPVGGATAENLAYVSYTSGSTGKPKGVAMRHRPLSNLIWWQLHGSTRPEGARTLQFASLSFDVSFQEIFSTWCSGGTLILISKQLQQDAVGLLRFLEEESVERLFLPFVALHQLAEVADGQGTVPASLGEIMAAGEQLRITAPIAGLFNKLGHCVLQNQYGPSETHVVTAFTLMGSPDGWSALPPIGRPIANTQIYLLNPHLEPVLVGVPGELYVGGSALARGYLNQPELTAERFVPNPFGDEPGARLYRTGDLARYLPDGNIEFLGRLDHQVKVRGFRVELGEIEAVLSQHPVVREVVVLAREDTPGAKRLVAYVVPEQDPIPTVSELRSFLHQKLPEYMVPLAFVMLDSVPLTPSGKIDRGALPAPDQSRPRLESDFVAPRTPIEEVLVGIWSKVLGIEQVGVHDNFFELGGHSLLATQVVSRVHDVFQVELPLRLIFEASTIADQALAIEELILKNIQKLSDEEALELLK